MKEVEIVIKARKHYEFLMNKNTKGLSRKEAIKLDIERRKAGEKLISVEP